MYVDQPQRYYYQHGSILWRTDTLLIRVSCLLFHLCREIYSGTRILHSPLDQHQEHKLTDRQNVLQSAHSFIHPLLLLLCATASPCPGPISLSFLPACLSRPLGPSHFHSYHALFCFHAGLVGGWSRRWRDDFMLQQQQKREEQATTSLRAYLSLN